jgi:predicted DNA-binding ribbon-helix-helix protein
MISALRKRSMILHGRKTSVSLEDEFWAAFRKIAQEERLTCSELAERVDSQRKDHNLSSAIRLFVLERYRSRLDEVQSVQQAA